MLSKNKFKRFDDFFKHDAILTVRRKLWIYLPLIFRVHIHFTQNLLQLSQEIIPTSHVPLYV
jgi:hypothetical protein